MDYMYTKFMDYMCTKSMDYLCTGTQFMDYMYKGKHVYTGKHMYTGKNMYTDKNMYTGTKFMDYMHTGKNTRFWEGGLGCRDKARMTRQDPHKYRDSKVSFAAPEAFTVLHSPKALMLLRLGSCQSTYHLQHLRVLPCCTGFYAS